MSDHWNMIASAIREERYAISAHAGGRIRIRRMTSWQIIAACDDAIILPERPDATPNPVVEVEIALTDGTAVKAVWAWLEAAGTAKG